MDLFEAIAQRYSCRELMLLAITAFGYGSTRLESTVARKEDLLKRYLGVPEKLRLIILLPVGQPASSGEQKPKNLLSGLVH